MTFESLLQKIKFHKEEIKKLRDLIKERQQYSESPLNIYYWLNKPKLNEYAAIYYQKNAEKIKKRRLERYYADKEKGERTK